MTVDELIEASKQPSNSSTSALVDGRWIVATPLNYEPIPWRIKRYLKAIFRRASRTEGK